MSDLPPEALSDCFGPPAMPTEVHCIHCDNEYQSYLIEWREKTYPDGSVHGFWCCPMPGCDGKGFGFDIFPTDPDWVDEDGEKMWSDDGGEFDDELEDPAGGLQSACTDEDDFDPDDDSIPLDDLLPVSEDPEVVAAVEHDMAIINEMLDGDDDDTPFDDAADDFGSLDTPRSPRSRTEWVDDEDIPF